MLQPFYFFKGRNLPVKFRKWTTTVFLIESISRWQKFYWLTLYCFLYYKLRDSFNHKIIQVITLADMRHNDNRVSIHPLFLKTHKYIGKLALYKKKNNTEIHYFSWLDIIITRLQDFSEIYPYNIHKIE